MAFRHDEDAEELSTAEAIHWGLRHLTHDDEGTRSRAEDILNNHLRITSLEDWVAADVTTLIIDSLFSQETRRLQFSVRILMVLSESDQAKRALAQAGFLRRLIGMFQSRQVFELCGALRLVSRMTHIRADLDTREYDLLMRPAINLMVNGDNDVANVAVSTVLTLMSSGNNDVYSHLPYAAEKLQQRLSALVLGDGSVNSILKVLRLVSIMVDHRDCRDALSLRMLNDLREHSNADVQTAARQVVEKWATFSRQSNEAASDAASSSSSSAHTIRDLLENATEREPVVEAIGSFDQG